MSHERNRPAKAERKPKKQDKKRKGLPPHLQRQQERSGSLHKIQDYLDEVAERQK